MYKSARRSPLQSNINDKIQSLYVKQKNLMFVSDSLSEHLIFIQCYRFR